MPRLNHPRIFGVAALLILAVTLAEIVLKADLKPLMAVLAAVCAAGMIGTIAVHGTGPPDPLPPSSPPESEAESAIGSGRRPPRRQAPRTG